MATTPIDGRRPSRWPPPTGGRVGHESSSPACGGQPPGRRTAIASNTGAVKPLPLPRASRVKVIENRFWPVGTGPPPRTPTIRGVGNVATSGSRPARPRRPAPRYSLRPPRGPSAILGDGPYTCDRRRTRPESTSGETARGRIRPGAKIAFGPAWRSTPTWPPHPVGAPVRHRPGPVGRTRGGGTGDPRRPAALLEAGNRRPQAFARPPARKGRRPRPVPLPPALAT